MFQAFDRFKMANFPFPSDSYHILQTLNCIYTSQTISTHLIMTYIRFLITKLKKSSAHIRQSLLYLATALGYVQRVYGHFDVTQPENCLCGDRLCNAQGAPRQPSLSHLTLRPERWRPQLSGPVPASLAGVISS